MKNFLLTLSLLCFCAVSSTAQHDSIFHSLNDEILTIPMYNSWGYVDYTLCDDVPTFPHLTGKIYHEKDDYDITELLLNINMKLKDSSDKFKTINVFLFHDLASYHFDFDGINYNSNTFKSSHRYSFDCIDNIGHISQDVLGINILYITQNGIFGLGNEEWSRLYKKLTKETGYSQNLTSYCPLTTNEIHVEYNTEKNDTFRCFSIDPIKNILDNPQYSKALQYEYQYISKLKKNENEKQRD